MFRDSDITPRIYWFDKPKFNSQGCVEAREPTWCYGLFGPDGEYLYAGVAENLARRLNQHEKSKPWFSQVGDVFADLHCCRRHALEDEACEIALGGPTKNIARPAWYRKFDGPRWTLLAMVRFGLVRV